MYVTNQRIRRAYSIRKKFKKTGQRTLEGKNPLEVFTELEQWCVQNLKTVTTESLTRKWAGDWRLCWPKASEMLAKKTGGRSLAGFGYR